LHDGYRAAVRPPEVDARGGTGGERNGLNARARLNSSGDNESGFLDPLREVLASGKTPAERLLERYRGAWNGDISRIYEEESF